MFQVQLDEKTEAWLKTKDALTIQRLELNGCCVPNAEVQKKFAIPENEESFYKVDDYVIPIYIDKGLDFKEKTVTLQLRGFKPFLSLQVEGLVRF